jgi:hypothetical protein
LVDRDDLIEIIDAVDMIALLCNLKGEIIFSVKKERPLQAGEEFFVEFGEFAGNYYFAIGAVFINCS